MRPPRLRRPAGGPRPGRRGRASRGRRPALSATPVYSAHLPGTPVGTLRLWATAAGLRRLAFDEGPDLAGPGERLAEDAPPDHLGRALDALRAYFAGDLRRFDLPLDLHGLTDFQRRVYARLAEIPYGRVATYGEVARDVGEDAGAARAVGGAVGANPLAIVIPCHRVVASDGRLTGFGGGLGRKARLLALEGIDVEGARPESRVHPEVLRLEL